MATLLYVLGCVLFVLLMVWLDGVIDRHHMRQSIREVEAMRGRFPPKRPPK